MELVLVYTCIMMVDGEITLDQIWKTRGVLCFIFYSPCSVSHVIVSKSGFISCQNLSLTRQGSISKGNKVQTDASPVLIAP